MKVLYIGDIVGQPGMSVVEQMLPKLRQEHSLDLVIAQAENTTDGKGLSLEDYQRLLDLGIDFLTGGNWILANSEIHDKLNDPAAPIIRPANFPAGTPGQGCKTIKVKGKDILVVGLLGKVVGKDASLPLDNPLSTVDQILADNKAESYDAVIVDFHGDYSSEKVIIGHYLDGRVSAVIGDHWHVPTADARILPAGTAHISDVGMCGALNSSLGVSLDSVVPRWRDGKQTKNEQELAKPWQFNGVLIDVVSGQKSASVELIQHYL